MGILGIQQIVKLSNCHSDLSLLSSPCQGLAFIQHKNALNVRDVEFARWAIQRINMISLSFGVTNWSIELGPFQGLPIDNKLHWTNLLHCAQGQVHFLPGSVVHEILLRPAHQVWQKCLSGRPFPSNASALASLLLWGSLAGRGTWCCTLGRTTLLSFGFSIAASFTQLRLKNT